MSQNSDPIVIRILASDLQSSTDFVKDLESINNVNTNNSRVRSFMLSGLVDRTLLRDGKTTLEEEILDQVTTPEEDSPTEVKQRYDDRRRRDLRTESSRRAPENLVGSKAFEVAMDLTSGVAVLDIRPVTHLHQSRARNNASKWLSDNVAYGPRQNSLSRRIAGR